MAYQRDWVQDDHRELHAALRAVLTRGENHPRVSVERRDDDVIVRIPYPEPIANLANIPSPPRISTDREDELLGLWESRVEQWHEVMSFVDPDGWTLARAEIEEGGGAEYWTYQRSVS